MSIKKRCCSAMLAATMLSGVITQASAVGTEVLFENNISDGTDPIISEVVIPAQITLQMDKTGAVSVKEKDLKLSNTSQTSKATVKKISVVGKQGFSIADYSSDLESKPEGTKEVALQFNGDGTTSSGDVVLTSNWEIEPSNDKVLTINAKMPKQPADFEVTGGIATINWEIDTESTVITPDQSTIDDNWTKDKVLKTSVTPVTFSYDSTNPSTTLQNVESSNPDIVSVTDAGAGASFGNEQTANYNVQALAVGRSTITATLSTGESTQFDVEVYELDIPGSSGDGTTGEIAVPEVPGKGDGDKIETGDITIDIPVTTPDGDDTITVTPEIPEDTVLSEGENTIEVDVEVDGVTIHITIVINIKSSNPSEGLTQTVVEAQAMGFTFSSYEDGLQIDSFENKQFKSEINVPEQIGDLKVLKIGDNAFNGQTNLKKITLPDSVTVIGGSAFAGCTNLTNMLMDSVTSIGVKAFSGCTKLQNLSIKSAITIEESAFENCGSITDINIPDTVTSIGNKAFYKCAGPEQLVIRAKCTIGDEAFSYLTNVSELTLDGPTSLGASAFSYCSNLKNINVLSGVTSCGYKIFSGVTKFDNVYWNGTVVGKGTFQERSIKNLTLGDDVETIQNTGILDCYPENWEGQTIKIKGLKTLESESISIGSGVTLDLSENNVKVASKAIQGTKGCKVLINTDKVKSTASSSYDGAFSDVTGTLEIVEGSTTISGNYGRNLYVECMVIPSTITTIKQGSDAKFCPFGSASFDKIIVNCNIEDQDSDYHIWKYATFREIVIGEGVTSIGNYAFDTSASSRNTNKITLPSTLKTIGDYAFWGLGQNAEDPGLIVTIPDGVTEIGRSAFYQTDHIYYNGSASGSPWDASAIN